jgi:membrane-associated phospholipid phosphatase
VSFPSGHVVLFASLVVPLLLVVKGRARWAVIVGLVVIVGFVGAQRMALSAHFLSDDLGGLTYVLLWTYLCALVARPQLPDED